ncbi:MAG TPA: hypothetical protein VFF76_02835 [Holophagaceae bacterium]|jgi:hypothetical protein|nr:hypothetical protein [Holophagaceae bacterium]
MIRTRHLLLGLTAALPLLLVSCIKGTGSSSGATNGTVLYLFDGAASQILVWKDLSTAYSAATTPAADLTLTSTALTRSQPVAWGGMTVDTQRNHLYLLYQDGSVIRIDQLRSQSGTIISSNLAVFTLDSSQRLTGSVFGQLALDAQNDKLYACEHGTSGTSRVWAVSQPDAIANSGVAAFATVSDDESGTGSVGAAAGQGAVFGYFAGGNQVISGISTYNGPRLRKGTSGAFVPGNVLIGDTTGLDQSATGSLALDTANSMLFVGLDAGSTTANSPTAGAPVLAFQTGQFGLAPNQQPKFWLGSSSTGAIMALSHAGTKAWLVGLQGSKSAGIQTILVWQQPASGVAAKALVIGPSSAQYLAAALDGSGS